MIPSVTGVLKQSWDETVMSKMQVTGVARDDQMCKNSVARSHQSYSPCLTRAWFAYSAPLPWPRVNAWIIEWNLSQKDEACATPPGRSIYQTRLDTI